MTVQEQILEVKRMLRLSMNGEASKSMRESGIGYGLNFGVELPRLKEIAGQFGKDSALASALWKENVRECRMLAALIYPQEEFLPDMADLWVGQIEYPDLAEVCSMYLFSRMKDASGTAFRWIASGSETVQYCGFLTMAHLLRQGREMETRYAMELRDQAAAAIGGKNILPAQAARTVLGIMDGMNGQDR